MDQPVLDHHYIVQHLGGAKRVRRRLDGASVCAIVENSALTVVPAGTCYQWRTEGPIEFAHLYISPAALNRAALRWGSTRDPLLMDRVGCIDPVLQSIFSAMQAALSLPAVEQSLYLDGLLETFLLKLIRDHTTARLSEPKTPETLAPFKLKRVLEFVEAHMNEHVTLSMLAGAAGASAYHFSRAFKNSVGVTPYQYVLRRRVERALELLRASGKSQSEVAAVCGFSDSRHLTRAFRRLTGRSPGYFAPVD